MSESSVILNHLLCVTNQSTGPATTGTFGGSGTKIILSTGTTTTSPYALGIGESSLWLGTPSGASHIFYCGTTEQARISSSGLIIASIAGSTGSTSGALVVGGGVGIGGGLNIGGGISFTGGLNAFGVSSLTGTLTVSGNTTIGGDTRLTSTTASNNTGTGALVV